MERINFLEFLQTGNNLSGIILNDPKDRLLEVLGKPKATIGDKNVGFFQYENGLRYGYFCNEIDELAIMFVNQEMVNFQVETNNTYIINNSTTIHEFISFLNHFGIGWRSCDEKSIMAFSILTESGIYIVFNLESGKLHKISKGRE